MRCLNQLKSRTALFTLLLCALATFTGAALYLLASSTPDSSLPRCWLLQPTRDSDLIDCSKLVTVLGHDAACGQSALPESCCMLVTIIAAKRCHCRMDMPKQALARMGEAHQQCLRRMEAGLILTNSPLPSNASAALPRQQSSPSAEFAKVKATMHGELGSGEGGDDALAPAAAPLEEGAGDAAAAEAAAAAAAEERRRPAVHQWSLPDEGDVKLHKSGHIYKVMTRGDVARHPRPNNNTASSVRLFVGVLTAGKHADRRQAARETWASDPRLHRVVFFSAKPTENAAFDILRAEAAEKGDVVVLPGVFEHYGNITHQTLEIFRAASLDPRATHVMKVDDDSYVHMDTLMTLMSMMPAQRLFLGNIDPNGGGPHRDSTSPWYVSYNEWESEEYPLWAHGAGYVLSKDLVTEVAAGAAARAGNHSMFKLEDIAVGSWVAYIGKEKNWRIRYVSQQGFDYEGCRPGDIVSHYIRPDQARCIWASHSHSCCVGSAK